MPSPVPASWVIAPTSFRRSKVTAPLSTRKTRRSGSSVKHTEAGPSQYGGSFGSPGSTTPTSTSSAAPRRVTLLSITTVPVKAYSPAGKTRVSPSAAANTAS